MSDSEAVYPPLTAEEREAYALLYAACYSAAIDKVRYTLDDPDVAEDIVQSAFLKVWCNWSTVASLAPQVQRGYVLIAVRNAAKDELRHRLAHPGGIPTSLERELDPLYHEQRPTGTLWANPPTETDPESDPERMAIAREGLDAVFAAEPDSRLRRLEILLLAQGYGPAEVAARLRLEARWHPQDKQAQHYLHATGSSVKMRRARHRQRLQRSDPRDLPRARPLPPAQDPAQDEDETLYQDETEDSDDLG